MESLCLITKQYTDEEIKNSILNADIIYVGGGDTLRMIKKWKAYKVDLYLKEAYEKGIVLSGISAGSICWFEFGHSDSDFFINNILKANKERKAYLFKNLNSVLEKQELAEGWTTLKFK